MQLKSLLLSLLPLALPTLASANPDSSSSTTITLHLPASPPVLPNPAVLPASTRATLSALGKSLTAPLSGANTFVFRNVSAGSYLLDVHCPTHGFVPYRVDVVRGDDGAGEGEKKVEVWETFRGGDWGNKGGVVGVRKVVATAGGKVKGKDGGWVVEGRVLGEKGYFMERSTFSIMSIFKNPMILISVVSMVLFLGLPKLVENMDPEMRAEWEENQKSNPLSSIMGASSGQQANPMSNFDMAAFLAGSSSKTEDSNGGSASAKGKNDNKKKR